MWAVLFEGEFKDPMLWEEDQKWNFDAEVVCVSETKDMLYEFMRAYALGYTENEQDGPMSIYEFPKAEMVQIQGKYKRIYMSIKEVPKI